MSRPFCHRVGLGFDSHLFDRGGSLRLGGVRIPGAPKLKGHSDGDAVLHAVIDALLGAAAAGDIGELFPDSSNKWKGADSAALVAIALRRVKAAGYRPASIDVTVVADRPRLGPVKESMRKAIAAALSIPASAVGIKAKTQEGLAWFRKPGGVAAWAVAMLEPVKRR